MNNEIDKLIKYTEAVQRQLNEKGELDNKLAHSLLDYVTAYANGECGLKNVLDTMIIVANDLLDNSEFDSRQKVRKVSKTVNQMFEVE